MKAVTTEALRWDLREIAKAVASGERVTVTFRGTPRFAVVPLADLAKLVALDAKAKPKKRAKS